MALNYNFKVFIDDSFGTFTIYFFESVNQIEHILVRAFHKLHHNHREGGEKCGVACQDVT